MPIRILALIHRQIRKLSALIRISGTEPRAFRVDPHASAFHTDPQLIRTDPHFRLAPLSCADTPFVYTKTHENDCKRIMALKNAYQSEDLRKRRPFEFM